MQTVLFRIWTWIAETISNKNNCYANSASIYFCIYVFSQPLRNKQDTRPMFKWSKAGLNLEVSIS